MKIAFLFPGQGAQKVGMGKDLYDTFEEVRNVFKEISELSGIDMGTLCFEGKRQEYSQPYPIQKPLEVEETKQNDLDKTENAQLAIATVSLAILEVLKREKIQAEIATGLSLGEYTALLYGGKIDLPTGVFLLKQRGYFMGNIIPKEKFQMAAVIGLETKKLEEICKDYQEQGKFVVPANYNYSGQTVISGNKEAVEQAIETLKQEGAKKVVLLNTSGPFHTMKLEEASKCYAKELAKVSFQTGNPQIKIIKNRDGSYYEDQDKIKEILEKHIISPVRFDKAIALMQKEGVDTFVEIGPGKALTGFIKKEIKEAHTISIFDVPSLEHALQELKEE